LIKNKRAKISDTCYNQYKCYLWRFDNNINHPEYVLSLDPGSAKNFPIYCTQHYVEQYFKHAVCKYVGKELQWAIYHAETQKGTKLILSPIINDAIQ
jgi:hypothetical protein